MTITKLIKRQLTNSERFTIERVLYYTEKKSDFALIGKNVVALFHHTGELCNIENMHLAVQRAMESCVNSKREYALADMDDGRHVIHMRGGILAISDDEYVTMADVNEGLLLRRDCINACKRKKIFAVVIADDSTDEITV